MEESKVWLAFSIGPVQDFIQGARSVRDLKAGSVLLCHLVSVAIQKGKDLKGNPLYPSGSDIERNIPNQFTMAFASKNVAENAEKELRKAIHVEWNRLTGIVFQKLDALWRDNPGWSKFWKEQTENFWSVRTAILDETDLEDKVYNKFFSDGVSRNPWQKKWRLLSAALAVQKQIKPFTGDCGIGRDKCTMMGALEQMGPGGAVSAQNEFWCNVENTSIGNIRLRKDDRLCAVGLVKRFVSAVEKALSLSGEIPDTAKIAVGYWQKNLQDANEEINDWESAAKALRKARNEEDESLERYLLDDSVDREDKNDSKEICEFKSKSRTCREKLSKKAGAPPRYLAVLKLDGDNIGEKLDNLDGSEVLSHFSQRLSEYANETKSIIEENHCGHLVYAGGDDILALMPLGSLLDCCVELREKFPKLPPNDIGTASIGIVVFHYKHPLHDALHKVEATLKKAKEAGRDRLGWQLIKHSGGPLSGTMSWEIAKKINGIEECFEKKASDRWLYGFEQAKNDIPATSDDDLARTLLEHFIQRMKNSADANAASTELATHARKLFDALMDYIDQSHKAANERIRKELKGEKDLLLPQKREYGFMPSVVDAYVQSLMFASFLARGKD